MTTQPTLPKDQIREVRPRESLKKILSDLPAGRSEVTARDLELLLFVGANGAAAFEDWPDTYRDTRGINRLKEARLVSLKYWPLRYALSRAGFRLVAWANETLEHLESSASAAPQQ